MCPSGGSPKTIINNAISPSGSIIKGEQPVIRAETCYFCGAGDLILYRVVNGFPLCLKHADDFIAGRIVIDGKHFNSKYEKLPPPELCGSSQMDFNIDFSLAGGKELRRPRPRKKTE